MTFRSAFFLPAAICPPANVLAAQVGIDPEALHNTLSVPLVPINGPDDGEPTHFGCCGILTDVQRAALEQASGQFPGALWWRWEEPSGALVARHDGATAPVNWGWSQALKAANLKVKTSSSI